MAFSLAESPWLNRIWTSYPAAFERILEAGLVLDPARLVLGRQYDANRATLDGRRSGASFQAGEVAGRPVTGVDHGCLDIGLVDRDHLGRLGRHVDLAVVVGGGLLGRLPPSGRPPQR